LFPQLNLPAYPFKIKTEGQRTQIFDRFRKKYVALTAEEWVRQHFINYLIAEKKFPESLITTETGVKYNTLQKRGDIFVYDDYGKPLLIVECKSPTVSITQKTFDQIAIYNKELKVKCLVITNGIKHYCCLMDYEKESYQFLEEIPLYSQLIKASL